MDLLGGGGCGGAGGVIFHDKAKNMIYNNLSNKMMISEL
jgi:hypothetical protein